LSIVIDSSVVIAALVDTGDKGAWAEKILEQDDLYAPELLRVESANVLRRLERGKEITGQEANAAFEDLMELDVELHAFEPFSERVWELRHNVTSYDGWYVALAEALNLPLATLDGGLVKADGPKCRFLTPDSDK
jgi:predicted nucleic acid-binding protein